MPRNGWIKLYRKIEDNPVWGDKPFSKGQAWIDLLLKVNHKKNKVLIRSEIIEVAVGETITSIKKLCERWGWSNTKVNNFLNILEKEKMILCQKNTGKYTSIKVLNYKDYQHSQDLTNIARASLEHTSSIPKTSPEHINKNEKNDNNEKKNNKILLVRNLNKFQTHIWKQLKYIDKAPKFDKDSIPYKAALHLRRLILKNNPRQQVPKADPFSLEKWSIEMDRLNRLGPVGGDESKGYSWDEIAKIMSWCQDHYFWKKNILSAGKLREKVGRLEMDMKQDHKSKPSIIKKQNEAFSSLYQKYKEAGE